MSGKILLIDDEPELLSVLKRSFKRQGYTAHVAESGEEGWQAISETQYDLVITDLALQDIDGLELLGRVRSIDSTMPVIIMTGVGSIETAVEAIKLGAYHYISKPFKIQDLELMARRAVEHGKLHRKLEFMADCDMGEDVREMVVGNNPVIQEALVTIDKVSDSDAPVLIQGETGTGKSMIAKYIHQVSSRRDQPFFTIDCSALVEHLLESELFGHVKGAFTGAVRAKRGLLEEAQGGSIFLDEIGELSQATQVKLLRAIQDRVIRPVGGNSSIDVDVRFISATSRRLEEEVEEGLFREDLYYRLAVIPLRLPPLRERHEDLIKFIDFFIRKFNARYNKKVDEISPSAMQMLKNAPWKGNIRALENVIERAVLLAEGGTFTLNTLSMTPNKQTSEADARKEETLPLNKVVAQAEIRAIRKALETTGGNRSRAAQLLGIGRRPLYDKIEAYHMRV